MEELMTLSLERKPKRMKLSQEQLDKYVLLSLTDDEAATAIYEECGSDATSLLSVAEYILENIRKVSFYKEFSKRDKRAAVDNLLMQRRGFLNRRFSWTEENKKRFLYVNDNLLRSCEKAWDEAMATAAVLEERIKQNDPFLKDYEIFVTLNAYPSGGGDYKLDMFADVPRFAMSIGHSHYEIRDERGRPIAVDKTMNWNNEYFGDVFKNDYICFATHCLLDTYIWSFEDIISISSIWADVEVTHQNYIDLEPLNNYS